MSTAPLIVDLTPSWFRSLAAEGKTLRIIENYREGVTLSSRFLADGQRSVAATAANRFRSARLFFRCALEEGEIDARGTVRLGASGRAGRAPRRRPRSAQRAVQCAQGT